MKRYKVTAFSDNLLREAHDGNLVKWEDHKALQAAYDRWVDGKLPECNCYKMLCDKEECWTKANERKKNERKGYKLSGLCQECGKNNANSDGYRCDPCIELMRLRGNPNRCHTDGCYNDAVFIKECFVRTA